MKILQTKFMHLIALAMCVGALASWGAVGFFVWYVSDAEAEISAAASDETGIEIDAAVRLHALARATEGTRAELEQAVHREAIFILEAIEAAGEDARVEFNISQARADAPIPAASAAAPSTRALNVTIEAQGTFTALMHAVELLSTLPFPSRIDQMHLERLPSEGWRLVTRVQVLTTADISS